MQNTFNTYTTTAFVKDEIRATSDFSTDTVPTLEAVKRYIDEASKEIEVHSNMVFGQTTQSSQVLDYDGSGILRLPRLPIVTLSELLYNSNSEGVAASWVTLQSGIDKNYITYDDEGEVVFVNGINATNKITPKAGKQKFTVSYDSGYASIPFEVQRLATLIVAKRVIMTLASSQSNSEGGDIQIGTIKVSDPSNYSINYIDSLNKEIDRLYKSIGQDLKTYRIVRDYDV